jgi:hypothetical protein
MATGTPVTLRRGRLVDGKEEEVGERKQDEDGEEGGARSRQESHVV